MRMFSIYSGNEVDELEVPHTNILICDECVASGTSMLDDADELIEMPCDPGYEDRCKLCGKTFVQEIEEQSTIRIP